jgi:uncharacterized damage-inducible protein DinB
MADGRGCTKDGQGSKKGLITMTSHKLSVQVAINSWRLVVIFVSSPDRTGAQLPLVGELRKYWDEVNGKLLSQFASLSADEWLQRHYAMSEEDYAKDQTRNRLAVLLSRTNHMSYHLGQMTLALK